MDRRRLLLPVLQLGLRPYFRLTRGLTLGVRGLVFDEQARVLLVSHTYAPGWHLPGGGVEKGERLEDALRRELREEASVDIVGRPRLLGVAANFAAMPGDHVAVYAVEKWTRHEGRPPRLEIRAAEFFPTADLPSDTTTGTRRRIAERLAGDPVAETW